jgi:hypothetical protein
VHMCEFCGGDYENEDSLLTHVKQMHPPDEDSETDEEVSQSGLKVWNPLVEPNIICLFTVSYSKYLFTKNLIGSRI